MSLFYEKHCQHACTLVEEYYRPLIGDQALLVTGETLKTLLLEKSSRPHWRRIMLDIVEGCTSEVNIQYAIEKVNKCFNEHHEEKYGILIILEKDEWENNQNIVPLGYLVAYETMVFKKRVHVLSLVCSTRAKMSLKEKKQSTLGKGFGSYLVSVYLLIAKLMHVPAVVLEVLPSGKNESGNWYGTGSPLNCPLRNWYLSFGFVEDPSIALGKKHEPMVRGLIKNHDCINQFSFTNSFYRTMVIDLKKQNHEHLHLETLVLAVTRQSPFIHSSSPFV